jgi:hypothetical protein
MLTDVPTCQHLAEERAIRESRRYLPSHRRSRS